MTTIAVSPRLEGLEYRFSIERLEELNRSAAPMLLARLNAACPSYGKTPADIDDPTGLVREIRSNCSDDSEYIRQSMPLQEIAFRTLLLAEDQTMTLGELHYELTEKWSSPIRPITVTIAGLARILDSDEFYGFELMTPLEPEVVESATPALGAGGIGAGGWSAAAASGVDTDEDDDDLFDDDPDEDDPYEDDMDDEDDD